MDRAVPPVPDGITPLTGYRMWRVVVEEDRPALYPMNLPTPAWRGAAADWVSASCLNPSNLGIPGPIITWPEGLGTDSPSLSSHHVPEEDCECGFYAFAELDRDLLIGATRQPRSISPDGTEEYVVIGRVELAGKVIVHERGYRAERARIVELIPIRGSEVPTHSVARRLGLELAPSVAAPPVWMPGERWTSMRAMWTAAKADQPPVDGAGTWSAIAWIVGALAFLAAFASAPSDPWSSRWGLIWGASLALRIAAPFLLDAARSRRG